MFLYGLFREVFMLKKVLVFLMFFFAVLFFTACGNETNNLNEENTDDGKNGEEADNEKENPDDDDENLKKGDLSGCLLGDGMSFYPVPRKVILQEKDSDKISFYYQDQFYAAGNDFYYSIIPDETDDTLLNLYLKAVNNMDGSLPGCDCPMRIGMEFSSEDHDLTKIEKVKIDFDFYWNEEREDMVFSFEKMNCFYIDKLFEEGDTFTEWCNVCTCTNYGDVACDEEDCSSCVAGSKTTFYCENESEVEWCECLDPKKGWNCLNDPQSLCEEN
jgi:hypothetical protein